MNLFFVWKIVSGAFLVLTLLGIILAIKGQPGTLLFFGLWLVILLMLGTYFLPPHIMSQDNRAGISTFGSLLALFGAIGSLSVLADLLRFRPKKSLPKEEKVYD